MEVLADRLRLQGNALIERGEVAQAESLFTVADGLYNEAGALYDEAKNKEKTIASMKKAIELNPKNSAALNYLGYTWAEMGVRLDEAEDLILRALKIEPNDGFYIDSLGWVYYQKGDYLRAVEQLERAVEAEEAHGDADAQPGCLPDEELPPPRA